MTNQARLQVLRAAQGADGGWGFFPGKQSWLEPTVWALLALRTDPQYRDAFQRGWQLVRKWQMPDGAWQANAMVKESHWTTALAVLLHFEEGVHDDAARRGVDWLLGVRGVENSLIFRFGQFLHPKAVEFDASLEAWPWRPKSVSWVEPTAHSLVALRRARTVFPSRQLDLLVDQGEKMLLDRRCRDGGWNYGNRRVLEDDLPSYPETTGVALYGLSGNSKLDVRESLTLARRYCSETHSPLAQAWLALALCAHGVPASLPSESGTPDDILVTAIEAVALSGGVA